MRLDRKTLRSRFDGRWFPFGETGAELKIRPFIRSQAQFAMKDGTALFLGEQGLKTFVFCLEDWRNVVDTEDKAILLTEELKKELFDSNYLGIADFVVEKNMEMAKEFGAEIKN